MRMRSLLASLVLPTPATRAVKPAVLLLASVLAAAAADPATYLRGATDLLEQTWPSNRTVTIVCHGHSVPAGYFRTPRVDTFNAYPHLMHVALKERHPRAVLNVIVTAIGGEDAERGAARFARDVLSLRPDVVTLDYALNDRRIGLVRARAAWGSMIEQAKAHGIPVLLCTPTWDLSAKLDQPDDPLRQHAEQIRQLAAEYEVGLADSLAAFQARVAAGTAPADLMAQVNHPNRAGHELVLGELLRWFPEPAKR